MTKDSPEYKELKERYEADQKYRRDHPDEYPWFVYHQYGFHRQQYLSEKEAQDSIKFYRLYERTTESGDKMWFRNGRQPISLMRRRIDD